MNRFQSTILWRLAGAGLLVGCGACAGTENAQDTGTKRPSPAENRPGATPSSAADEAACPLALVGTKSFVQDTVDGVVVVFATPRSDDVAELRQRVGRLAVLHNSRRDAGKEPSATPPHGPGPGPGGSAASSAALEAGASVEPGDGDVRLVLRPADPAQLDSMRDVLRHEADELVRRACPNTEQRPLR